MIRIQRRKFATICNKMPPVFLHSYEMLVYARIKKKLTLFYDDAPKYQLIENELVHNIPRRP